MRTRVSVVLAVLLSGCYVQGKQIVREPSRAQIDPKSRDATLSRAVSALQQRGWIIAVSDRTGGLLTTQVLDKGTMPCGAITCPARDTLQISVSDAGMVIVNLHREFYLPTTPPRWFQPTVEQDVLAIEREQDEVLQEIAMVPPLPPMRVSTPH